MKGCYVCNSLSHIARDCPKTHFVPDREFIILKNKFSVSHV